MWNLSYSHSTHARQSDCHQLGSLDKRGDQMVSIHDSFLQADCKQVEVVPLMMVVKSQLGRSLTIWSPRIKKGERKGLHLSSGFSAGNEGYTALGDSYSAGVGAGDLSRGSCQQAKTSSWPYYISQKLVIFQGFTLAACSGATTKDVYDQISGLSPAAKAAKLITITVGGNDILFANTLIECSGPDGKLFEQVPCDLSKARAALSLLPGDGVLWQFSRLPMCAVTYVC